MQESTKDTCAEFSCEKPGTSASIPISTTQSDSSQKRELSTSSTSVESTVLTRDITLPITSSGIRESVTLLSRIIEYSLYVAVLSFYLSFHSSFSRPGTSASIPISTTQSDTSQTRELSSLQTTISSTSYISSTTVVSTTTSVSTESSTVLTCDVPLPITSSGILENVTLRSGVIEFSLKDSDSDDEASNSNTVYNNELFDSEKTLGSENDSVDAASSDAETTSSSEEDSSSDTEYNSLVDDDDDSAIIIDNSSSSQSEASANDHLIHSKSLHHVFDVLPPNCISSAQIGNTEGLSYPWSRGQKRKRQDEVMHCPSKRRKMESPIPSKPTCFKESLKRPASGSIGYDFFCENAASSDCDSASSSEEDSWSDESSSSKREASSTESDESNEMTKNQQIHSASLHKASDVLMTDCISSAQIGNTEGLCYPGGKGQKRKRQDEGLHYFFKRRKIESLIPSKPTCFQESRKRQTSGSTGYDTFRDKTASSDDDSTSSSQENPWLDESSSSQREASSTESDESNAMTTEQQIHSASLHKASDGSMSNCITLTGIANTKSLSYPEASGEKRKRQDEDSRYPTKKRKIELPIPSTSTNFTGSRKRPVSGSTDAETLNRVPKTQNIYPDSQDYSCPNTCPCKTPDQPVGILPIDRIFKVNKPLYIKLLQSRTLDSHNLSHYRCCEKSCSIRWYQGRVPAQFLLDEY